MINKALFSSERMDWETPQWLFDKLNNHFHFELDVCATSENTKCKYFWSEEQDGLSRRWSGNCWMNPPYGRGIDKWVRKAYEESQKDYCVVVGLVPVRTDTAWWQDYILNKAEVFFLRGRLKFSNSSNSAPFPSAVIVWRKNEISLEKLL